MKTGLEFSSLSPENKVPPHLFSTQIFNEMQIKHSMNLINLRGWPRPAGWNSGRPVGSVVLIYSAIALQWFIYLIGMDSNILLFSLFLPSFHTLCFTPISMHTLCWMSCLCSSKREKKLTCQYSLVRSGLTFEMLIALIRYRLLDTSMRQSEGWCASVVNHSLFHPT